MAELQYMVIATLEFIFGNVGKMIVVFYLITIVPCMMLKNRTAVTMMGYLGLLELAAWTSSIWTDPIALMSVHALIFTGLFAVHYLFNCLDGLFGDKVLLLGALMVITDAAWFALGGYSLAYHSIINILYLLLLHSTLKASYTSLKMQDSKGGRDIALWYPKIEENVFCMPLFR